MFGNRLLREEVKDRRRKVQRKRSDVALVSIRYESDRIKVNELYGSLTRKIDDYMKKSCMVQPYGRDRTVHAGARKRGVLKSI